MIAAHTKRWQRAYVRV